jgi:hypothetical protein
MGLLAVAATELGAGLRLAGGERPKGAAREAAALRVMHAGALVASARRVDWRLPLVSGVIVAQLTSLAGRLAARGVPTGARGQEAVVTLSLLALVQLRQEAARAEAWNTPLGR